MAITVNFDNYDVRDYVDKINDIVRGLMVPRDIISKSVPGMAGQYFVRANKKIRVIEMKVTIAGTKQQMRSRSDQLATVLLTEKPAPLVITDEPNKTYYGIVADETPFDELSKVGKATITFMCLDPYKYGDAHTVDLINNGSKTFSIIGNGPANPVFVVSFSTAATYLEINIDNDHKIRIIYDFQAGQTMTIDCSDNSIKINGVVQMQTMTLDSIFFDLKPGSNTLNVSTDGTATINFDYAERWS